MVRTINPNKVNGRTIKILEEEGLAGAVNMIGEVLDGPGADKHGHRIWSQKRFREHFRKAIKHLSTEGIDAGGTERYHAANGGARVLMMLQMLINKGER